MSQDAIVFARSPAGLNDDLLDYHNSDDVKIYRAAVVPLDPKFDMNSATLLMFLEMVRERAEESNWKNILMIPDNYGVSRHLLTEYGRLSHENIRSFAETYNGKGGRQEQNSAQMYTCLSKSLTEAAKTRLQSQSAAYRIGPEELADGPCYLRLIIQKCTTDSRATVATIRNALSNLPSLMTKTEWNIEEFNQQVRVLRNTLLQRGEDSSDLLVNLFAAYRSVQDRDFHHYMRMQHNLYIDGAKDFEVDQLMEVAANKYKMIVEEGSWKSPTASEEQFVALTAEIAALRQTQFVKKGDRKKKVRSNTKGELNSSNSWRTLAPKEGDPHTKSVGKRAFIWCPHHKAWGGHQPSECFKIEVAKKLENDGTAKSAAAKATIQFTAAYTSMMEDNSDEE